MLDKITSFIKRLTKKQRIIVGVSGAVILAVLCVGIGLACYHMNAKPVEKEKSKEVVKKTVEPEVVVKEVASEPRKISFSGTSIEKDLKIKIVDETDALVAGVSFRVTVTAQKTKEGKDYTDDDTDGIIYITDMTAGEYTVQLHEVEGFVIAENTISMNVKEKIEYKKVDVTNEIKQASEVDIEKEDAPVQKPKEENKLVDTVELLESTKTQVTVAKENVDVSNFTKATVSEIKKQEEILGMTTVTVPESITLYEQGGEQSRTYALNLEIADENQIIQGCSWQSDAEGVFTVDAKSDKSVILSATRIGAANLYLTVVYGDGVTTGQQTKVIQIPVTVSELTDDEMQLKDKERAALYLDKELKQPAMLKDYSSASEFYAARYTGWQTIDKKLYYYNKNHKAVTGVQIIGGARYTFGEDGALLKTQELRGIDVSKWQKTIDWNAVANAGIDFAIIRAGNRGTSTGVLIEDPYFKKNIAGATKAGIKVGVYIYSQAITEAEAVEEASMAISLVAGYRLQLPIYFDTEGYAESRANNLSVSERTAVAKAFCETVRNAGYMPGIYSNYYWLRDNLNMPQLEMYSVWVAHYATACGYPNRYDIWQYTSQGSVPGIDGRVDLNISYVGY